MFDLLSTIAVTKIMFFGLCWCRLVLNFCKEIAKNATIAAAVCCCGD